MPLYYLIFFHIAFECSNITFIKGEVEATYNTAERCFYYELLQNGSNRQSLRGYLPFHQEIVYKQKPRKGLGKDNQLNHSIHLAWKHAVCWRNWDCEFVIVWGFTKAFDVINQEFLLDRLNSYGIRSSVNSWTEVYWADWNQSVTISYSGKKNWNEVNNMKSTIFWDRKLTSISVGRTSSIFRIGE